MYEKLEALDNFTINFSEDGILIVNIVLAFIMFGIALDVKFSDFKQVFLSPKPLIVGLFSQWIALPAVTFLIVAAGYKFIPPSVAMGMILVAACPGGNMSNYISSLAKANIALSVSLTGFSTAAAVIMTPLNFRIWGGMYINFLSKRTVDLLQPLQIDFPQILITLCILLALPLILGMLFSRFFPKIKDKILRPIKFLSLIAFSAILIMAMWNNLDNFLHNFGYIFIIVLIHNGLAITTGFSLASLFKHSIPDRRTISIETGIQNSGLGLALLFNPKIFPPGVVTGGMLFVTAWWGVWHIASGLIIAFIFRRLKKF
ncbi:MAG: bile acid:sodium symporter family protein [Bacteroidales bacterium]|jgi:BASS family bile acid:Na+ symporter|nr:bile acid:sodium symporter family protein [Bacteroidales bacterium]